ncbi:MAG: phytoene desaturase family protein [Methermicoccaceae archaeon]
MGEYDAIVVGCGMSGLLAGLALAKEGKHVLMLERDARVGGVCSSYELDGYVVDTGPHIITGLESGPIQLLIDKYFDMLPKFVESGEYFVRFDGKTYVFPWTIPDWLSFPPFSVEDRLNVVRGLFDLLADYVSGKKLDKKVVSDYVANYSFSKRALKFIDSICLFLTGVGMEKTPVSRILLSGRSKNKTNIEKIKAVLLEGGKVHHYPKGGIQNIVKALMHSLPKSAEVHTGEEAINISVSNGCVCGVATNKAEYYAKIVIYAGMNKHLPDLVELPDEYSQKLRGLEQARTLALWLGLNKKYFERIGSEIWTETRKPCWVVPTSNLDATLAPKGKQLVAFAFVLPEGEKVDDDSIGEYIKVVEEVFPSIKEHVDMVHYHVLTPEQASNARSNFFSGVKLPIDGMYAVGTDVDRRSMGITRAAYSVISLLERLEQDGMM